MAEKHDNIAAVPAYMSLKHFDCHCRVPVSKMTWWQWCADTGILFPVCRAEVSDIPESTRGLEQHALCAQSRCCNIIFSPTVVYYRP